MKKEESVLCPNCFKEEVNINDKYDCKHCGTPLTKWDIEHTPQLDSDVELALTSLELMNRALTVPNVNYELTNKAYNTIKQHISNQQSKLDRIEEVISKGHSKDRKTYQIRERQIEQIIKEDKQ